VQVRALNELVKVQKLELDVARAERETKSPCRLTTSEIVLHALAPGFLTIPCPEHSYGADRQSLQTYETLTYRSFDVYLFDVYESCGL